MKESWGIGELDYDLPIVNRAVVDAMLKGVPPEVTVNECQSPEGLPKDCEGQAVNICMRYITPQSN